MWPAILGLLGGLFGSLGSVFEFFTKHKDLKSAERLAKSYAKFYANKTYPGDKAKLEQLITSAESIARLQFQAGKFVAEEWVAGKIDIDVN